MYTHAHTNAHKHARRYTRTYTHTCTHAHKHTHFRRQSARGGRRGGPALCGLAWPRRQQIGRRILGGYAQAPECGHGLHGQAQSGVPG